MLSIRGKAFETRLPATMVILTGLGIRHRDVGYTHLALALELNVLGLEVSECD